MPRWRRRQPERSSCVKADGEPKRAWPNHHAAQFVADLANRKEARARFVAYPCDVCGAWHVGTRRKRGPWYRHRDPVRPHVTGSAWLWVCDDCPNVWHIEPTEAAAVAARANHRASHEEPAA